MRKANNTNNYTVEGLVAKYRNFVKENTPKYTTYVAPYEDEEGGEVEWPKSDIDAGSDQQLIVTLYTVVAKENTDKEVLSVLSEYADHFYRNALNEDEFSFLCDHFSEVIDYEFNHRQDWYDYPLLYEEDKYKRLENTIQERVPYTEGQTVFIPDAGSCDLAIHFKGCRVKGYTSFRARRDKSMKIVWALGQIRLFAVGVHSEIVPYIDLMEEDDSSQTPDKNLVDMVVCLNFSNRYETLYRLLKKDGQMFMFVKRDELVDYSRYKEFRYKKYPDEVDQTEEKMARERKMFFTRLIEEQAIKSIVSFEDEDIIMNYSVDFLLLQIEKKGHSTVIVESINNNRKAEIDNSALDVNLLWPGYYLANRPKEGVRLSSLVNLFNIEDEVIEQYWDRKEKGIRLSADLRVLAPKYFSENYSDSCLSVKDLAKLSDSMFKGWDAHMIRIHQPGVCMIGNKEKLIVGYINEDPTDKYLCVDRVPYLIPKRGIDVRYVAALLLSPNIKQQIITICDGIINIETLSLILDRIIVPKHTPKERMQFLAEANYKALLYVQQELKKNHEDYKKAVRMRKHALTQKLSTFKEKFIKLNTFRMRNGGKLNDEDVLSRITGSRVKDAFEFLNTIIEEMMPVIEHIADVEYSFKKPERINIKSFIENYIAQNMNARLNFAPIMAWNEDFSQMYKNIYYNISMKLEDEDKKFLYDYIKSLYNQTKTDSYISSINTYKNIDFDKYFDLFKNFGTFSIWFPEDALTLIINNIVSNAKEHAFTDESRTDYMLRFSLENNGTELSLIIENNGTPIPEDRDTASLLEYGVSSALHQNGHNGIGCNEIDDIMRRYDGSVEIISTPKDEFTVKYILTFNSIYDSESGNEYYTKYLNSIIQYLQEKNDK